MTIVLRMGEGVKKRRRRTLLRKKTRTHILILSSNEKPGHKERSVNIVEQRRMHSSTQLATPETEEKDVSMMNMVLTNNQR